MSAEFRIDFQGRRKVQTFSGARVQPMGDGVQFALAVARQVRAFGHVLAQQAIRVLGGATLPGAIRIGNGDVDREPLGQLLVLSHFFPTIIGQRFAQQGRHVPEFLGAARSSTRGIGPVPPGQDEQAGGSLDQGPDGRPIASPVDEIALPVARHGAGRHLGGALGKGRHVGNLAASVGAARPRPARRARLTQCRQQGRVRLTV